MEIQLISKIIDCHMRLNRLSAIENNVLNFSSFEMQQSAFGIDAVDGLVAQAKAHRPFVSVVRDK